MSIRMQIRFNVMKIVKSFQSKLHDRFKYEGSEESSFTHVSEIQSLTRISLNGSSQSKSIDTIDMSIDTFDFKASDLIKSIKGFERAYNNTKNLDDSVKSQMRSSPPSLLNKKRLSSQPMTYDKLARVCTIDKSVINDSKIDIKRILLSKRSLEDCQYSLKELVNNQSTSLGSGGDSHKNDAMQPEFHLCSYDNHHQKILMNLINNSDLKINNYVEVVIDNSM